MNKGPGHVFVAHGDLLQLACDAVLVPTDRGFFVPSYWGRWVPRARQGTKSPLEGRVSRRRRIKGQTIRYVVTGKSGPADDIAWLGEGVRAGLDAAVADCSQNGPPANDRDRHLIAMPLFGIGTGGYDDQRGQAIEEVLSQAQRAATRSGVDVAVICRHRSEYTAVQSRRDPSQWVEQLSADQLAKADDIGHKVQRGEIALFLGAGVSRAAGLPDWSGLLINIAKSNGIDDRDFRRALRNPPAAAAHLKDCLGDGFIEALKARLQPSSHAIAHALLASLRVDEVVTTNVDPLYEMAAAVTFDHPLAVLPWGRQPGRPPWLLKLHGDLEQGELVFTAEEYRKHSRDHRPLGSLVQALLMTRHLVFVGYSLRDEDFVLLAKEVARVLRDSRVDYTEVGSVLAMEPGHEAVDDWERDLRVVLIGDEVPGVSPADARALEVTLDRVAWRAARVEASWLLDERYRTLLADEDKGIVAALNALQVPPDAKWHALRHLLRQYGRSDMAKRPMS